MINDDDESLVDPAAGWRLSINRSREPATSRRRETRARPSGTLIKETWFKTSIKKHTSWRLGVVQTNKCSTCLPERDPQREKTGMIALRGIPTPHWNDPSGKGQGPYGSGRVPSFFPERAEDSQC